MAKSKKSVSFDRLYKIISSKDSKIHFIGVGGVSMYSLARLSVSPARRISGSDREESERTRALSGLGVDVSIGHREGGLEGCDLVVYSHAIREDDPELLAARKMGTLTVSRAEYLGALMLGYKTKIGISGTHGKSTTVAMLDTVLASARRNHTTLSGAKLITGEPYRMGNNETLLYEACEYKDSFLKFLPSIAVALNLEYDHPDYFESVDAIKESFEKALSKAERALINIDDMELLSIKKSLSKKTELITFGQTERADIRYRIVSFEPSGCKFTLEYKKEILRLETSVGGAFNVLNAAAAASVALLLGIEKEYIFEGIKAYRGIEARMEHIGSFLGRDVFRDYAHHPTEIRATLNALKMMTGDEITVVFKPHTFSRTKALFEDFKLSLSIADYVILTDIFPAREESIEGISSQRMAEEMRSNSVYIEENKIRRYLENNTRGAIMLMGAGNMDSIKKEII